MTNATARNIDILAPAMKELETRATVKLRAIESERHYRAMVEFMNDLLDEVGDRENHPLMGLLDIVTAFPLSLLECGRRELVAMEFQPFQRYQFKRIGLRLFLHLAVNAGVDAVCKKPSSGFSAGAERWETRRWRPEQESNLRPVA